MLELFVVKKDFRTFKISYAAKVVGAELSIHDGFSTAELAAMDSSAKDMLLKSSEGYLSQHVAIMRYIAGSKRDAGLLGANEEEEIQIDQWSESSWQELGITSYVAYT